MRRTAQLLLLALLGTALLYISLFDDLYLRYVKESLRPLLIVSGILLLLLALAGARAPGAGHEHHGHDHAHLPRVAWLLFLPALALLFHTPPPLGSFTAARDTAKPAAQPRPAERALQFAELPAADPVPMGLGDFTLYAQQDRKKNLQGRTVQLTGFATPGKADTWQLTRLLIACCAADSQSVKVEMHGAPAPPADTWVTVTGTWHPRGTLGTRTAANALDITDLQRIPQPPSPYTDTAPRPPGA